MDPEQAVKQVYIAINARNVDHLLPLLHSDVAWPTGEGDTRLHGREAVREQMTKVFASNLVMHIDDVHINEAAQVVARVRAVIQDKDGNVQVDETGKAIYTFQDGLIRNIDLMITPQGSDLNSRRST